MTITFSKHFGAISIFRARMNFKTSVLVSKTPQVPRHLSAQRKIAGIEAFYLFYAVARIFPNIVEILTSAELLAAASARPSAFIIITERAVRTTG